jgi:hypothetical protein
MKHKCFHPACDKMVATDLFGCREHWYALPPNMRNEIWRVYREWKAKRSMYHYGRMKEVQKKALDFVTNRSAQIAALPPDDLARNLPSTHLNCIGAERCQANTETSQPA